MKEREIHRFIEEQGGKVISIRRKKHDVVFAVFEGRIVRVVLAQSPSDHRTLKNTASDIRRALRTKS